MLLGDEGGEQDGCNLPPGGGHSSAEKLLMNLEGTELKNYSQFSRVPIICTYKLPGAGLKRASSVSRYLYQETEKKEREKKNTMSGV